MQYGVKVKRTRCVEDAIGAGLGPRDIEGVAQGVVSVRAARRRGLTPDAEPRVDVVKRQRRTERMPTLKGARGGQRKSTQSVGEGWVRVAQGSGRSKVAWKERCGEWTEVVKLRRVVAERTIHAAVASGQLQWVRERLEGMIDGNRSEGVVSGGRQSSVMCHRGGEESESEGQVSCVERRRQESRAPRGTPNRRASARAGLQVPQRRAEIGGRASAPPLLSEDGSCERGARAGPGVQDAEAEFLKKQYG